MLNLGRHARRGAALLCAGGLAAGLAACGSSSGQAASSNPQTLLHQTFSSGHTVKSGVLSFSLVITPTGSSIVSSPVSLSLGGPFQSRGAGKTPESAFTIAFSGLGKHGSFGVRTTSAGAYVNLEGANYRLPAADFAKLSSTLKSNSSQSSAPGLSTFGIDPENWLSDPKVVGTQTIDGTNTEHLTAAVDVPAFLQSIDKVLAKEDSRLGADRISPATAAKVAADVKNPVVDVYTGKGDSELRRLVVSATVPVSGSISTRLGGLTSASFRLTLNYSQLNQPQTIAAPSDVQSYTALETKLRSLGAGLESELGGGLGSTGTTSTPSTGSAPSVSKYSRCINGAHGNVTKMQKCASLLQSAG